MESCVAAFFGAGFADEALFRNDAAKDERRGRKAFSSFAIHQIKGGVAISELPLSFQRSTCRMDVFEDLLSKMKRRREFLGAKAQTLRGKPEFHS